MASTRFFATSVAIVFPFLLLGCGGSLAPAPGANTLPHDQSAAVAESEGVRVVVEPDEWAGTPEDLDDVATPLRVTIENGSENRLRIRYDQFTLTGPDFRETALAPFEVDGAVIKPVFMPQTYYTARGFTLAYYYRIHRRDEDTFEPRHPWNYDEYTPKYNLRTIRLPTADMLAKGIPEGVLEAGGEISGFLYFPRLVGRMDRISFNMDLVDADTERSFGTIRIPFVIQ